MLAARSHSSHVVCFQLLCRSPPPEGTNTAPPPSRPRAIRARSEEITPRRHHRHRRHNRHRSRSRHDPQRGEIQPPAVAPQLRAPVPSAAPPAVPPGYWHVAPDASPFRGSPPTFARHPPPRPRTPHRGEPPVRAKSAPAERSPRKSSSGSDVPPKVWFAGSGPPQTAWPSGPPGSWRPQPPRPVVPRPGFLSEPKKGNQPPPQTSGTRPSSTPAQEKPAKNPDSTSKVKHNVAPVTPPYNPPEREPKATPRKREKKQEPGKASTEKPPAVEKTADEMLDEELRKNTAQSSTDRPAEVGNFSLMPTRPLEQNCSSKVAWRRAPKLSILPTLSRPSWHMCFLCCTIATILSPIPGSFLNTPKCEKFAIGSEQC